MSDQLASFGPNEWLVEEMYENYLFDPNSVDKAWWDFFADFKPGQVNSAPRAGAHPHPALPPVAQPAPPVAAIPEVPTPPVDAVDGEVSILRGVAGRVVANMDASLTIPTATSVRAVPAKLLIDNRIVINNHLRRTRGGKVSFTHIIGYALIKALRSMPEMNSHFMVQTDKPAIVHPNAINLGIAIDLAKPDGSRQLLVPAIKNCNEVDFAGFWIAYEDVVRKARSGALTVQDFAGTTITLTNPGTIGTVHSVPRLMNGQGTIIGVGAMEYPAEFQGASEETLAQLAVSKVFTLTSTYDHRIIQGAQSGAFLGLVHHLLLGQDGFYDEIFASLKIPYEPIRWLPDVRASKDNDISKTARVQELIHAYRVRGHLMADTDPLEFKQRSHPDLDVSSHSLTLWDLDREVATGGFAGKSFMKLRDILGVLRDSYCRTIGIEYMHIQEPDERKWIQNRVEIPSPHVARDEQLRILRRLNAAEAFEHFLQTKYVGQKRFSLEGGESVIPILDAILSKAADIGLAETCIGMPHRGRLNVLANIAGKSYEQIFREFEGNQDPTSVQGSGDVKYHLGTYGTFTSTSGANTSVYLAANPSHLEAVNPVLEGIVRAKQDRLDQGGTGFNVLPVLLHGDAAFAGQGVVAETLNLSQLRGYRTGGTIHVIINNQVGFTTAPASSRSSVYSTDVARMVQAPIFHVNGDDPEACVRVAHLAFEYRQRFNKDVVIDMVCYRRRGHNEADEPSFTQPMMYKLIDAKRSVRKLYTEALVGRGDITVEEASAALKDYQNQLEGVFEATHDVPPPHAGEIIARSDATAQPIGLNTAISDELLRRIAASQIDVPEGFTVHPKLLPQLQRRATSIAEGGIDWATGEALALGSILADGQTIRLTGQDSRRGTFGQRHCVVIDKENGNEWTPLASISPEQGRFLVYDSLLSEFAAMGFEYGYSVERADALVIWEAQFGDFADGAQTIIDEFISSSFQKWGQRSSLVLLLPHGYEGQGPDHSSARIERFLALCAEDNLTVAQPSTPASYFHLLRGHAKNPDRRPLIVFTPKSMLRLKAAASEPEDFTSGKFQPVIDDVVAKGHGAQIRRVALCSGKLYYELAAVRDEKAVSDVALLRIEQFYPMPTAELNAALANYPNAEVVWVQDEPANQGAWPFIGLQMQEDLSHNLRRISRARSASPATGSHQHHEVEQAKLITEVFEK
ncbi:MAG TPA: multifunctional oxoglutarate decarboxylase/oxoglutarate dehydrogenase thiamine pyrophosphate-binding subunit/dihydrolipoyllysine-residue succinyltransferase subunit [Candidatus Nanopelagicaceae bacterium]|nr:multifunctional oxoglutarate decarboxylase/oxoglutarate dehydrogenase thiamine pyrophosphate-binding subunit/dihydrolipoyllysine-residue succinyltransferase subunit [Candidatus Nanopelagicaceae bacterium]